MPRKKYKNSTKILYHKRTPRLDCPDGIAAAWVVKRKYPEAQVIGCIHQTEPPQVDDSDTLIIVDFSFPIAILNHWRSRGCSIILIDHHKTLADHVQDAALDILSTSLVDILKVRQDASTIAETYNLNPSQVYQLQMLLGDRTSDALAQYPQILHDFVNTAKLTPSSVIALQDYIVNKSVSQLFHQVSGGILSFDMKKCGAVLAWEYFFPDEPIPTFLQYVQDRDLFKFELPHSEEIHEAVGYLERKFEVFDLLYPLTQEQLLDKYRVLGETLLSPKRKKVAEIVTKAHWQIIEGYRAIAVELPSVEAGLASDVGYALYTAYPECDFAAIYSWVEREQRYKFSFRADQRREHIDLSKFADRKWGGGGHPPSAGAVMDKLPWS